MPLLDEFLQTCSVNRVPISIIDPTVLKSILETKANQNENHRGDCRHLCQKSSITVGVLESNLSPNGLNGRVCDLSSIYILLS